MKYNTLQIVNSAIAASRSTCPAWRLCAMETCLDPQLLASSHFLFDYFAQINSASSPSNSARRPPPALFHGRAFARQTPCAFWLSTSRSRTSLSALSRASCAKPHRARQNSFRPHIHIANIDALVRQEKLADLVGDVTCPAISRCKAAAVALTAQLNVPQQEPRKVHDRRNPRYPFFQCSAQESVEVKQVKNAVIWWAFNKVHQTKQHSAHFGGRP